MNAHEKVALGQLAETERGQIKEAVEFLKLGLLEKIAKTDLAEREAREDYYMQYRAIDMVMARLQSIINRGKLAVQDLEE
jgi:hypothetical protein